ncbi:MAG: right-handed parallel beta-helix repeat-containing protein [Planctomycetota bacterium]|nr:right-handed parallel beta-helix repeat-containing protein [Planctomycetota bacterium]
MSARATPFAAAFVAITAVSIAQPAVAGDLDPPAGPIQSTMKQLDAVEPRIALSAENTPGREEFADGIRPCTYLISEPGSYYLTQDLIGEPGKVGVFVNVSGVSIDLMGFTLRGVEGSMAGIIIDGGVGVSIQNGVIRDWDDDGLFAGSTHNVRIADVHAIDNGDDGISAGPNSVITNCIAANNTDIGISASTSSIVLGCVSRNNGDDGFSGLDSTIIVNSVAENNDSDGILAGRTTLVVDCAARDNDENGINCLNFEAMILRCAAARNGENGIIASARCYVRENTCDSNGQIVPSSGAGIRVTSSAARVEANHCTDNVRGFIGVGSPSLIIRNTASGNTVANWDIPSGNVCWVLFANTTAAEVNGNSGGIFAGTSSAWVNWTY